MRSNKEGFELIVEAIEKAGYEPGKDVKIAIDVAASEFYEDGKYHVDGKELTTDELINFYEELVNTYPIISIEDPVDENDWEGFKKITKLLEDCYEKYGLDYWIFQTDMEKYYENLSHEDIMHLHEGINPYGYFLLRNIVDSWEEENCYAKLLDLYRAYGIPKGNLPSQWFGITMLNELDHLLTEFPNCEGEVRYMDDLLCFFPTKKDCILCKEFAENYLHDKRIGVRLHPTKTRYAPVKCGFNFCGWRLCQREDGSIEVKLRRDRKTLKKKELKSKQKAYREGRITWEQVSNSMQSTFAHYKHGDTKNLRKYISNIYRFQRDSNYYNKRNNEKD